MKGRKHLGMGLDVLLKSNSGSVRPKQAITIEKAVFWYEKAYQEDARGNHLEAYYLYRTLAESVECSPASDEMLRKIASRGLNNAAVLLAEAGEREGAKDLIKKALELWPGNLTAAENLNLLSEEVKTGDSRD